MKRGLNNWGKVSPPLMQTPKTTPHEGLKKESTVEMLHSAKIETRPHVRKVIEHELPGNIVGKRSVDRVM
jgi:hypothetical protein